jgi:hypothetical protein
MTREPTCAAAAPNLQHLPERWRRAPRRWGHPLHSLCSYFAMFPPQLPHVFIRWLTEPGDAVYDPFAGRGTVALEAVLSGRRAYASDANPLAVALSAALNTSRCDSACARLEPLSGRQVRRRTAPRGAMSEHKPRGTRQPGRALYTPVQAPKANALRGAIRPQPPAATRRTRTPATTNDRSAAANRRRERRAARPHGRTHPRIPPRRSMTAFGTRPGST